jgi:hypothetical protein
MERIFPILQPRVRIIAQSQYPLPARIAKPLEPEFLFVHKNRRGRFSDNEVAMFLAKQVLRNGVRTGPLICAVRCGRLPGVPVTVGTLWNAGSYGTGHTGC